MQKKLSIAFIWHMHQPVYRTKTDKFFLMPWVRLHAVKDYLDMLLIIEKFPKIKLNFNLVPVLIDALEAYTDKNFHDIHSQLTITPIEDLTDEDKMYILNHFFDANYANMILHHSYYNELYEKRFLKSDITINDFTNEEYSDIMTWFNLAWIDPRWKKIFPEINYLLAKERNFSIDDRKMLINLHRKIMRQIIPAYKKFQEDGRIEISTSPYFHPILPILINAKDVENPTSRYALPNIDLDMAEDAEQQLVSALNRMEEVFGRRPQGIWASEQCISKKTIDLIEKVGAKWTIADEGILANSLNKEFVRDFRGYLEDPYALSKIYRQSKTPKGVNVVFRDSVLPNLISFEYPNHDSITAANDLYERIKTVQSKLATSPDKDHLLTIAMDGENSWENYHEDGELFLSHIYKLIDEDTTLETVLLSDYTDRIKQAKKLDKISAGSWINRDFQLWIGEPTKNLAWRYLNHARKTLVKAQKKIKDPELLKQAWKQIYIAESSDWFWWYGEPNDSGQDQIFDYLFREHLKHLYIILDKKIPEYLERPLVTTVVKPSRAVKSEISPPITGSYDSIDNWQNAGQVEILNGPNISSNKIFTKILYGFDKDNLYLHFDINPMSVDTSRGFKDIFQVYVYFKTPSGIQHNSNIRVASRIENSPFILKEKYDKEVMLTFYRNIRFTPQVCYSSKENTWVAKIANKIESAFNDALEVKIPFKDICVKTGENFKFMITDTAMGIIEEVYPQDMLINITRPTEG